MLPQHPSLLHRVDRCRTYGLLDRFGRVVPERDPDDLGDGGPFGLGFELGGSPGFFVDPDRPERHRSCHRAPASSRRGCILPRLPNWCRAALMRSACATQVTSHMLPCSVSHLGQLTSRASAVLWTIVSFPSSLCIYIVAPPVYTRNPTPTPTQPPHRRGLSHAQETHREYLLPRR